MRNGAWWYTKTITFTPKRLYDYDPLKASSFHIFPVTSEYAAGARRNSLENNPLKSPSRSGFFRGNSALTNSGFWTCARAKGALRKAASSGPKVAGRSKKRECRWCRSSLVPLGMSKLANSKQIIVGKCRERLLARGDDGGCEHIIFVPAKATKRLLRVQWP